jgi:hypothetical protein
MGLPQNLQYLNENKYKTREIREDNNLQSNVWVCDFGSGCGCGWGAGLFVKKVLDSCSWWGKGA